MSNIFRKMSAFNDNNPLLSDWKELGTRYGLAPFNLIKANHFEPAFEVAMQKHLFDISEIVKSNDVPTFENVIVQFDKSGSLMKKISNVYSNLCSSLLTPDLQVVQKQMAPILTNHYQNVYTYEGLFDKISIIWNDRLNMNLDSIQIRLIEQLYNKFQRNGAKFTSEEKIAYGKIKEELSSLYTTFSQNVMIDENEIFIELSENDLDGLPNYLIQAAKNAAKEREKNGYVITISRSLGIIIIIITTNFIDNNTF